ncbi:parathyroid hormone 4 [Leucoraja erinacea]|uniref:parathyroid hormone 4 n=1 Tax=Leucoraja erinaceus TaxID=7782 RepID=UPI002457B0ED|nr:parathyroid hormone 4 [Leucoraja erinacea]
MLMHGFQTSYIRELFSHQDAPTQLPAVGKSKSSCRSSSEVGLEACETNFEESRMVSLNLAQVGIVVIFCSMSWLLPCEGNPRGRRTVSEHQEMHDRGRFLQDWKRMQWLEKIMESLHTAVEVLPNDAAAENLPGQREPSALPHTPGYREGIASSHQDLELGGALAGDLEEAEKAASVDLSDLQS